MKKQFVEKKKFQIKKDLTEETKIKRRAIFFGFLTIIFGITLIIWGIPIFIKMIDSLSNLKDGGEEIINEDVIPPPIPRISFVPEATNSATLFVSGFTEPNAEVKIKLNEEEFLTKADEEGKFLVEKLTLKKGKNYLSAFATDAAGNQSETSEPLEIIYDDQPPKLEIESPKEGSAVEEQNVEVKGTTEPGARLLVNDHLVIVDNEGRFSTEIILKEGGNEIAIVAQDSAGNQTEKKISVTYLP